MAPSGQGIDIGDAVLTFLGDSTQLDQAFDSVGAKAKAGLQPATDALDDVQDGFKGAGKAGEEAADEIEDAGKRSAASMREAKGEAALLGEEFGIRLPRHVRNFVAELPGVGSALSAAFSATAVLFLVEALVSASEKLAAFVFKEGDGITRTVDWNKSLLSQAEALQKVQQALDDFGKSADELSREKIDALRDKINEQEKAAAQAAITMRQYEATFGAAASEQAAYKDAQQQFVTATKAAAIAAKEHKLAVEGLLKTESEESRAKNLQALTQEIELRKKLANVQVSYSEVMHGLDKENADEARYRISLLALQAQAAAESKFGKDSVDKVREINAKIEALQTEHALKATEQLKKQTDDTEKILAEMQKTVVASGGIDIVLPKNVQDLLKFRQEAKDLGITLGVDLVEKINLAKKALQDYTDLGGKDEKQIEAIRLEIAKLVKEYDALGQVQDKEKLKSETTWAGFVQDVQRGINATHEIAVDMQGAFNSLSGGLQNAFQMAIAGEKGVGKALEEATAKALESLAAQAAVKAIFYTAEGFAELAFGVTSSSAAELFEAAALMATVAGAAGIAGRAIGGPGGGGSNNNNASVFQNNNGGSNTGSAGRGGTSVLGVQHFATGGLITAPTLAVMGEQNRAEAVLPLEDPRAMDRIGKSISAAGGGGGLTVHVHGLVSPDNLKKVMKQMSKMVQRNQADLHASHSLRVNKRSA
jgi:hypothetical protein